MDIPENGPLNPTSPKKQKQKRHKWTREEYREIMKAYFKACLYPSEQNNTEQTYAIWSKNKQHDNMDANKLANLRRDIVKNNRLTSAELEEIKREIHSDRNEMTSANKTCAEIAPELYQEWFDENEHEQTFHGFEPDNSIIEDNQQENHQDRAKIDILKDDIIKEWTTLEHQTMQDRILLPKIQLNRANRKTIELANRAVKEVTTIIGKDITTLNGLIYSAATVITRHCGVKLVKKKQTAHKQPAWKRKIEKEIEQWRGEISILEEVSKGSRVKSGKVAKLKGKYKIRDPSDIPPITETLKQKVLAKAQRVRRYEKRGKFFRQNRIFKTDAKKFYRQLGKGQQKVEKVPSVNEIEDFWKNIWSNDKEFNRDAEWIKDMERSTERHPEQEWEDIQTDELTYALRRSSKWKSPGIDKVPNFWLNSFSSLHDDLAIEYTKIVRHPEGSPAWLVRGITYLLAKSEDTSNPKNYRPITCLSTMYKILTSILTERTYTFLDSNDILPTEQKGCKRGSYGCKDQLLVDKMVLENCHTRHSNLSTAWIDYKKAFDSVPHSWILKALEIFKISPVIINFISQSMTKWETELHLNHTGGALKSSPIKINCGIFQGDSLSPLLFCLALIPLSHMLNNTGYGYDVLDGNINHLFYMDDLKLYGKDDSQIEGLLRTVKTFSDDIGMEFGLDKCAKATFKKGKLVQTSSIDLDIQTKIQELEPGEAYKYLGVNEGEGIQHSKMKEKIRKECYRRVRLVLKTELNAANRIDAINSLAIPVVTYSFNIINWQMQEIRRMDSKIRKLMTIHRMHHPKADVDRIYIPRNNGGRGLLQLELSYKTTTIGLKRYLENTVDWTLKLVHQHESNKKLYSVVKEGTKFSTELKTQDMDDMRDKTPSQQAKVLKTKAKEEGIRQLTTTWEEKRLHGKYPERIKEADVDQDKTHQWLRSSGLKGETEGLIVAAQDQSLFTRNYQANIVKNGADPMCRLCHQFNEDIPHLVSGCPVLAKTEFKDRHDKVGQYIHWKLCQHYGLPFADNWYTHETEPVVENDKVTILWDFEVHTDRTIKANRPDIIIKDYETKTCFLIDMTNPSERNTSVKELEKLRKYKDLEIEIVKMWHLRTVIVPVVIGALGLINKNVEKHIQKLPCELSLREMQKITLMGTARILRKTLSI